MKPRRQIEKILSREMHRILVGAYPYDGDERHGLHIEIFGMQRPSETPMPPHMGACGVRIWGRQDMDVNRCVQRGFSVEDPRRCTSISKDDS